MKKTLLFFIVCGFLSSAYPQELSGLENSLIVNTWTWEKSIGGASNPYVSTPQSMGFKKKVVFTSDGRVITYKNNTEIRNSSYQISKGIGESDHLEHELVTFEGKTYIIEQLDNQNLTIVSNSEDAVRTIFKR